MPITMICPNLVCRKTVVAPDSTRGKLVRCAHCNQLFRVPARSDGADGSDASDREPHKESSRR